MESLIAKVLFKIQMCQANFTVRLAVVQGEANKVEY